MKHLFHTSFLFAFIERQKEIKSQLPLEEASHKPFGLITRWLFCVRAMGAL